MSYYIRKTQVFLVSKDELPDHLIGRFVDGVFYPEKWYESNGISTKLMELLLHYNSSE